MRYVVLGGAGRRPLQPHLGVDSARTRPRPGPVERRPAACDSFRTDSRSASILLPDGRFWQDFISVYDSGWTILGGTAEASNLDIGGKWLHLTKDQMLEGSNWMSVADNYYENVGIQSNGTPWISSKPAEEFNGGIPGGTLDSHISCCRSRARK